MAEVSKFYPFLEQTSIAGVEGFEFETFSPPNSSFLRDSINITSNDDGFHFTPIQRTDYVSQDFESLHSDSNFFIHDQGDDEEDQLNFVTDLFESQQALSDSPEHSDFVLGSMRREEEPEFGSELGLESSGFDRVVIPPRDGLRIVDMDSESDSDAVEVDSGEDSIHNCDGLDPNCDSGPPDFWDCLQFHTNRSRLSSNDEFEWEEVNERENLSSVIDRIEEISVSSNGENLRVGSDTEEEEEEENMQNLEWQVLLAVNDLELDNEFQNNAQFGDFVHVDNAIKGSPPAAKSVIENLPIVILTTEDLKIDDVICAVCKDEVSVGEEVTRLPCCHHYHGDCIVPWLSIRNTCPVCRYELPTDDANYEKSKNGRADGTGLGLASNLQVRFNYQLLP